MPNERISMSKLKQLIGLQASNLSIRALSRALGLSVGAVSKYLRAVRRSGIGAADAEALSEVELEQRVFGPTVLGKPGAFVAPDCAWIHRELKRHRHVTLQLLWEEYEDRYGAAAYRRSAFCQIYRVLPASVHDEWRDGLIMLCPHSFRVMGARHGKIRGRDEEAATRVVADAATVG